MEETFFRLAFLVLGFSFSFCVFVVQSEISFQKWQPLSHLSQRGVPAPSTPPPLFMPLPPSSPPSLLSPQKPPRTPNGPPHKKNNNAPTVRRENFNNGKKIGLLFVGIAGILQIFVVGFLFVKRQQLLKVKDRYENVH